MTDRTRFAVAAVLLLIVGSWLVVDVSRGDWGRVAVRGVMAVAVVVAMLTLARIRGGRRR